MINGYPVTLEHMLACREKRMLLQQALLEQYHRPVISFCMNIPGPVKTNPQIFQAFLSGKNELLERLEASDYQILNTIELHEPTGDELLLSVNASATDLKSLTTVIEDTHSCGRLFDMDILDEDGQKLSRSRYRTCIICGKQAQECARSRSHTIEELQGKVLELCATVS